MMTMTTTGSNYHRGDVVLVLFPNSNLRTAKLRPALVVQANHLQTEISQIVVAMITSRIFRANHPSRVFMSLATPEGVQSGLLTDSSSHDRESRHDRGVRLSTNHWFSSHDRQ